METLPAAAMRAGFTPDIGYLDEITPADPAAGANLTVDLGSQRFLIVHSVKVTLATSAQAANRFLAVDYLARGGLAVIRNAAAVLITANNAGQVFQFDTAHHVTDHATGTPYFAPLVQLPLQPGWQLRVTVDAIDTTDQISACSIVVERFYGPRMLDYPPSSGG